MREIIQKVCSNHLVSKLCEDKIISKISGTMTFFMTMFFCVKIVNG